MTLVRNTQAQQRRGLPAALAALTVALATLLATGIPSISHASDTLADAARTADVETSKLLLKSGADVDLPEPDGTTPLLWAVYHSSSDLVKVLLDAGADPNLANDLDIAPLLQASRFGDAEIVSLLLASGARIAASEAKTETPLMAAARAGSIETVQLLLDAGSDPNAREPVDQQTALMWSVAEGHLDVTKILLDAGADPNLQARVSELSERKNADFPTGGFAALHWAARDGNEAMIDLLLANGADINARNGDGSTPMMLAIVNDRFDIAAKLLELGADANDGSLFYVTEMRDATTDWRARDGTVYRADHPNALTALDLTRLLLEAGADPNKPFSVQMHNASMCCDTKANSTAFFRAAIAADVEGLKLMLAHGADTAWSPQDAIIDPTDLNPVPKGNVGKTALMMAINGGKGVGVAGGPNDLRYGPPEFREAGNRDTLDAVNALLAAGADPNVADPNKETALHLAAKALHPGIVRALVAHGAALDAQDKEGLTPQQAVAKMDAPKPVPGFYFKEPLMQPVEMAALLQELAGVKEEIADAQAGGSAR
ncbi:MAG: ankyrin repeat domain-containing protein [Pseudomonadota bacterium]|nr:ankyrin repeat domain-containing protein [Pseudomonadota bacterium]